MRLFEEHIEFVGWGWKGRHRRTLALSRIKDLRWRTGGVGVNFTLILHSDDEGASSSRQNTSKREKGGRIRVHVKAAGLWKHEVEERAPNLVPTETKLPTKSASRARAA